MSPLFRPALAAVLLSLGAAILPAQPPAKPAVSAAVPDSTVQSIEAFAKLQRAINALRDKEQAELAEPRNKKVEAQAEIREKYRKLRVDSLAAHGYTAAQVSAMTQRLSGDDALRALFEAAMERLGK
jgi:Skp family chaperone for outer membrane proteins